MACAWPARLQVELDRLHDRRLQHGFKVVNQATHGMSTAFLASFGVSGAGDFGGFLSCEQVPLISCAKLIILDNAVNDGLHSGIGSSSDDQTRLLRFSHLLVHKLLSLPSSPGVIILSTFTGKQEYFRKCRGCELLRKK